MDIEQRDEPARTVAVHRRTIAMSGIRDFYDHAYGSVAGALARRGAGPAGPAIGWYHEMPGETCTISAGFPVDGLPPGGLDDEVDVTERPGGPALVAVHRGSYDALGEAWQQLMGELGARGVAPRGDFWEEYLTDPSTASDASEIATRLVLPLA
ncbi:GyrI-like domain-containing protein [Nakamurella deserti]|uniref:GyrI-like domain-containing protein n=1 Tax=Nakamurella deserti TaxID=2164074 RepID=UPI000DBE9C81|nr:GyrI-like domain-containing protein [Nakamurella deserti]